MVRLSALATACMVIAAACGASKPPASVSAPTSATTAGAVMPNDPHAEIERLYGEIETRRSELALPEPAAPAASSPAQPMGTVPQSTDATCKPAKTDRCTQSCDLSSSICDNAGRICELASQMPQDAWAADRCTRAKSTCDAAHDACCSCQ